MKPIPPTLDKRINLMHNSSDNLESNFNEGLCMRGNIRTEEVCPGCGEKFEHVMGVGISCPQCHTRPEKFLLDIHWQGKRYRIFRDRTGERLGVYHKAFKLLARINEEIEEKSFDPTYYVKSDQERYQFQNYVENWRTLTDGGRQKAGRYNVRYYITHHYTPFFKDRDIRVIRAGDIAKFVKYIQDKGISTTLQSNIVMYLKAIFRKAYEWEDIPKIPSFPVVVGTPAPFKWIDPETQEAVLKYLKVHHHPITRFLFMTGCRIAEATALKWDCIDWENRILTIRRTHSRGELHEHTKTRGQRPLYLTDELLGVLKGQWETTGGKEVQLRTGGYVFLNIHGRYYKPNGISHTWAQACKRAGVEITFYNATRHSFASQRVNQGFTLDQVGAVLGHSSPDTTKRYARVLTENLKEVMEGRKKPTPLRKIEGEK